MSVPWEISVKCDFNDDDFEDCNKNDMPSAVHELHRQNGILNNIVFLSVGISTSCECFLKQGTMFLREVNVESAKIILPVEKCCSVFFLQQMH